MNKNIVKGTRVSAEKYDHSLKRLVKIKGIFDGIACSGEAIILLRPYNLDAPVAYVVPSSLRKLVKKKKPYDNFLTSKGFEFQRTARGWIDQTSGIEWMNEFKTDLNLYDSEKWAESQNMRLPTRENFIEAESHGVRELPGMTWKGYFFCSSTRYPGYDGRFAYVFYGYNGNADYNFNRDDSYRDVVARAVRET